MFISKHFYPFGFVIYAGLKSVRLALLTSIYTNPCIILVFSAPEPSAQVHYCDHALSVVRPSVRRPSVRPPVVNFSHFRLLLWHHWTEFNDTWHEARTQHPLPRVCVFRADRKNKTAVLASDWLRHFRLLLWNGWTEFNETWQEARSQRPLSSLCFSGRSEKQDGRPGLWLAETYSTSPLKPLNGIQWNMTGSKISTSSTKFVFFGPISKQKCPPWLIPQKGGTLYSGARYVALLGLLFSKLTFNTRCSWKRMFKNNTQVLRSLLDGRKTCVNECM